MFSFANAIDTKLVNRPRPKMAFFVRPRFYWKQERWRTFLAERYYVTFRLWHEPSVCLSSVCDVVALRRDKLFGS